LFLAQCDPLQAFLAVSVPIDALAQPIVILVQPAGTDEAKAAMAKMKSMPINDFMTKEGSICEDGRVIRDMYLLETRNRRETGTC
jgi:hypothetical protein